MIPIYPVLILLVSVCKGLRDLDGREQSIYIEGKSEKVHQWEDAKAWFDNTITRSGKNMAVMRPVPAMVAWIGLC